MNCRLKLDAGIDGLIPQSDLEGIKIAAQDAMALAFYETALNNFGPGEGEDRPESWPRLSSLYAIRAHGGDTTPTLVLSEDLMASIDQRLGNADYASIFTDCEYAETHQYGAYTNFGDGSAYVPARPFFPVIGPPESAQLTDYSEQKCITAAQKAVNDRI